MVTQPRSGFTRIPFYQQCQVKRGPETLAGLLCNISVLGVYVTLDVPPAVGETVDLLFLLPGDAQPVEATATVTWQNLGEPDSVESLPAGCGLRFTSLAPIDHGRVEQFVTSAAGRLPIGARNTMRVPYIQRCRVAAGENIYSGVLCNLSVLGAYVTVEPIPEKGERVCLSFLLPEDPLPFQCVATVTWHNPEPAEAFDGLPPGCGLRFDALPPPDLQRIERVITAYCEGDAPAP
jgi:Tfp pilus assembly protein PilZ